MTNFYSETDSTIKINESEIKAMIFEGAMRILKEEYGTAYGTADWMPFTSEDQICAENGLTEEAGEDLVAKGIVPDELNRDFLIQASCSRHNMFDPSCGPTSNDGDKSFYGEYDEAVALINQIKDQRIKDILNQSLQAVCDSIECEDFQADEPDPDEKYETRRDMGEGLGLSSNPPFEAPVPEEPAKRWEGDIAEDDQPMGKREYDIWIGHSDLGYSSDGRFYNIAFYLDHDGKIKFRYKGSTNPYDKDLQVGQSPDLDREVENYMKTHMGEIKANLFI